MPTGSVFRATVMAAAGLLLAGCGSVVAGSPSGAHPASASPASASPASASSPAASPTGSSHMIVNPGGPMVSASPVAGCQHPVSAPGGLLILHNASNGGTYCVSVGQRVRIDLDSSAARRWGPIRSDSTALLPLGGRGLMLSPGQTGATFAAQHPGRVHLGSARPVCSGGPVHCDALQAFQVTIVVGGIEGTPAH